MLNLLSSLFNNFVAGLHKDQCKNSKSDTEYMAVTHDSLGLKQEDWNKYFEKKFNIYLTKTS